jgi:hypothetical protein
MPERFPASVGVNNLHFVALALKHHLGVRAQKTVPAEVLAALNTFEEKCEG